MTVGADLKDQTRGGVRLRVGQQTLEVTLSAETSKADGKQFTLSTVADAAIRRVRTVRTRLAS
eukprot:6490437-Prymnesium_polylepis.1